MSIAWETFPVKLEGGLITNVPLIQQGMEFPGSARKLQNLESSEKGGYKKVKGITDWNENAIEPYGNWVVNGSGQSGTSLTVSNIHKTPQVNDVITIAGVSGTYAIDAVSFTPANRWATLTLRTSLASSPADQAAVSVSVWTATNTPPPITGIHFFEAAGEVVAARGGLLWSSLGEGAWTVRNVPTYGTVLVNGASQAGGTLAVDGISSDTYVPQAGDMFTVAGIERMYTVTADASVSSGATTLSITPALASSPANNAAVTFVNSSMYNTSRVRFSEFNFDGTQRLAIVDGVGFPGVLDSSMAYKTLQGTTDIEGADYVVEHKDYLFVANDDLISYSVPFDEDDWSSANGAGNYRLPFNCTGLKVFNEQLINFTDNTIDTLLGNNDSDWRLESINDDVGCPYPDTIQEVGGDILFAGPDGIRYLGATDRIGEFSLALASRRIQDDMTTFLQTSGATFCSYVIRSKNQYRILKYVSGEAHADTEGFIAYQTQDQNGTTMEWSTLKGLSAYSASSVQTTTGEQIQLGANDGYVYSGETTDSWNYNSGPFAIDAEYYSPYWPINDPSTRKTGYKIHIYYGYEGPFDLSIAMKYDLSDTDKIQPAAISLTDIGTTSLPSIRENITGSFFTASAELQSNTGNDASFNLDTILLEYYTNGRN